jgi:Sec-independent protein secretion pathway component TatC
MKRRITRWLLRCYPGQWRTEYGDELEDLLEQRPMRLATIGNVLSSALRERARQPVARVVLFSLVAVLFAEPLWHMVSAPAAEVLRTQGFDPPNLVALTPWEQFAVIYLGIPMLVTAAVAYPFALLTRPRFTSAARAFALWSAALYIVGFFAGFVAWREGSLGIMLQWMPGLWNARMLSVSRCFELLAASTLGLALLLQIPVVAFYQITGAIQKTHRAGRSKHP